MKKILVLLLLFFSFLAGFSQTGNDTLKYTYYKFTYGEKFNRGWFLNVLDIPNDTTYSKYGVAKKGTTVYIGNGVKWTAVNPPGGTFATVFDSVATADRYFAPHGHNFQIHSVYPFGAPGNILIENLEGPGGNNGRNWLSIDNVTTLYADQLGGGFSQISLTYLHETFNNSQGSYTFSNLVQSATNDTATKKPLLADASGNLYRADGYVGGGGGGGVPVDVVTTINSGTSSTVPNGTNVINFTNSGALTYSLTLGTTWHTGNNLIIAMTGSGSVIITIINGSGHTLSQRVNPNGTTMSTGDHLTYHLIGTSELRMD